MHSLLPDAVDRHFLDPICMEARFQDPSGTIHSRLVSVLGGLSFGLFLNAQPCDPAYFGGTVDAGPDIITCGGLVQLQAIATGNFPGAIWEWGPVGMLTNPSIPDPIAWVDTSITYYVWVYPLDHPECAAMDSVTITVIEAMLVNVTTTDAICAGACTGSAQVSTTGGSGAFTYCWYGFADSTSSEAVGLCAGSYSMLVQDVNGCTALADYIIGEPEPLEVDAGADTTICAGQFQLHASLNVPFSDPIWEWAPVDQLSGANTADPLAWVITNTTYMVWVWPNGYPECAAADSIVLTVDTELEPGTDSLILICPNAPSFELMNMLGGSPATGGIWTDPFGMPAPSLFDPAYGISGTHTYTLTSSAGCTSTAYLELVILEASDPSCHDPLSQDTTATDPAGELIVEDALFTYVPSAFTPNGDGFNDEWGMTRNMDAIRDFELLVFDRWGRVVFETNDPARSWNGTFLDQGGEVVKEDVYAYRIVYHLTGKGEAREFLGHVTVLR